MQQLLELSYLYPSYSFFNESRETMYAAVLLINERNRERIETRKSKQDRENMIGVFKLN